MVFQKSREAALEGFLRTAQHKYFAFIKILKTFKLKPFLQMKFL